MKIKFLKAYKGDCILISFVDDDSISRNILIDGGMEGTYYSSTANKFGELKFEIDRIRSQGQNIDLLILTHIDNDHIGGLLKWFEIDNAAFKLVKNVWFNSGKLIAEYFKEPENPDLKVGLKIFKNPETGVNEAIEFEKYLTEKKLWERRIIIEGTHLESSGMKIQVLSPNKDQLKRLLKEYKRKTADDAYTKGKKSDWNTDLKTFIEEETSSHFEFEEDKSPKNGSSISFIFSVHEKNFLFLADSHPSTIVQSLKRLKFSKQRPLVVEFIKISHHGSKCNTNKELLEMISTNKYVISTDSSGDGHPNKRILARIVDNNPNAVFYFNYANVRDQMFTDNDFLVFPNMCAKTISLFPEE
jgi:beta-lactamase superfamily II metal-dependent hydrolase